MATTSQGFDFCAAMRVLCRDIVARLSEFHHIEMPRVAISLCKTRRQTTHGIYASLTPLRFEDGALQKEVRGRRYETPRLSDEAGQDILYILSFYLPRFQNTSLEEKLSTVVHELWHISPEFNGDLRRHEGRFYAHGPSQKAYDAQMDRLAQRWLSLDPPAHYYEFLEHNFEQLVAEHGKVVGKRWPTPKLLPH